MEEPGKTSAGTSLPKIGEPAKNALGTIGVTTLEQLQDWSQKEIAALHGMGPKAIRNLRSALDELKIDFRTKY